MTTKNTSQLEFLLAEVEQLPGSQNITVRELVALLEKAIKNIKETDHYLSS